jgi:hypothetical protein
VKRTALGQTFVGALVVLRQRDVMKRNDRTGLTEPVAKNDGSGKNRQELVLTLVAMPGTTTPAGLAGVEAIPEPGDKVRLILRGASFGQWIEAKRDHGGLETGDVVSLVTEYGQAFNGPGSAIGPKLTTQAEVDAVPRGTSVGIYGTLTLRKPTPAEAKWAELADAAYFEQRARTPIADPGADDDEPF